MKISTGIKVKPHFVVLYGLDGIGKTTFAAEAPDSIIVGSESGSHRINVARAEDIKTFEDILEAVEWLRKEPHSYKSVGIDSLDWIEPLLWAHLCKQHKCDSIESIMGGYGKGYVEALKLWQNFIARLTALRDERSMNVICIAHSHVKTMNDPTQALPYDRYQMKLHDKASALWREAVDAVLFATFDDVVFKVNAQDKKAKTSGDGTRKIYTTRRAAWDAKNRLGLPAELPLSWSAFEAAALTSEPDSRDQVIADLDELHAQLAEKDPVSAQKMVDAAIANGADLNKLISIRNHARVLVGV